MKFAIIFPACVATGLIVTLSSFNKGRVNTNLSEQQSATNTTLQQAQTSSSSDDATHTEDYNDEVIRWERSPRPFSVAKTSKNNFQWADADGLEKAVMKELANNSVMLRRFKDENHYVSKRQLIYIPKEFDQIAQGIYDGDVHELSIPTFDGEELEVVITQAEDMQGQDTDDPLSGAWTGYLKNDPDIVVAAGSDNNYWSINYTKNGIRYEYDNREHGEWILTDIDVSGEENFHTNGHGAECLHCE